MFVVQAYVYSMDFFMVKEFRIKNVVFRRFANYKEIREKIRRKREHYATGVATIEIPKKITDPGEAIYYSFQLLNDYSLLLSFAHGHDVFFNDFDCFDSKTKKWIKSTSFSIRFGDKTSGLNIDSDGFKDFLSIALPLIKNKNFEKRTGVHRAILFFNEVQSIKPIQLKHTTFFVALEILANSYARCHPKNFFLDKTSWKKLKYGFKKFVKVSGITEKEKVNRLLSNLGAIQSGRIVDKINYMCHEYGFDYPDEIKKINDMRNDIIHGKPLKEFYGSEKPYLVMLKIERLLIKLILKILNFYDKKKFIHPAILNPDLSARS